MSERVRSVIQLLEKRPAGLIRHELAAFLKIPLSSVCSLVHAMIERGELAESGDTRTSPFGQPARILCLPSNRSKLGVCRD